jgi:hypothetical protein
MTAGWKELVLENDVLQVTVLPEKGADIVGFLHKATGVDPLFRAPWGLQPPGAPPREGSDGRAFLENYEGCWQELFPNVNDPSEYRGVMVPFHGEVATLPWECAREGDALRCSVRCRLTPFRLERLMRIEGTSLVLDEAVTNEGDEPAHFVWGHHCVVGPPFLEEGCRLLAPARTLETISAAWEDTARLERAQRSTWPHARLEGGGEVDLSQVPGPEVESHDDAYLTDLDDGWVAVENPRLGLVFRLEWDPGIFRWIIAWQPYGGALEMPLAGAYALGIEPWVTRRSLADAIEFGEAIELAPDAQLTTTVRASIAEVG